MLSQGQVVCKRQVFTRWFSTRVSLREGINMATVSCRDCGYLLPQDARGCPQCALNLEAESMIDQFVWHRLVPVLIVVGLAIAFAVFYLAR